MRFPGKVIDELNPPDRGFTFRGMFPDGSPKEHICIVINRRCSSTNLVYYVYMTSRGTRDRLLMENDPAALAELEEHEHCDYFDEPKDTSIKCDLAHLNEITYDQLVTMLESGSARAVKRVPESVLDKIDRAIRSSKSYTKSFVNQLLS